MAWVICGQTKPMPGKLLLRLCLLVALSAATLSARAEEAAENSTIKFPSPDKVFVLRISASTKGNDDEGDRNLEVIEKASGKVVAHLGTAYDSAAERSVLVWSPDSKMFAAGTGSDKEHETTVYYWNGESFKVIDLPQDLPSPEIKFPKGADGAVKNYGGGETPIRWTKGGDLEIASESTMMSRVNDKTYTGTVLITISFDAQRRASIKHVSKTKTRVE